MEVMDASLDQLKERGLYNEEEMGLEEGVLLSIENMKYKLFNKYILKAPSIALPKEQLV
ncbi:hypothetical protein [Cytobacillus firmus]|uniref:hypothetical protein n=1 Tax=Cytobacillus firmus TaxID=1399 RepID=UPI0021AE27B4|nr:hypothetical protein [Cytobacillus firmus]